METRLVKIAIGLIATAGLLAIGILLGLCLQKPCDSSPALEAAQCWVEFEASRANEYSAALLRLIDDRPDMEHVTEQLRAERTQSAVFQHRYECALAEENGESLPPLPQELRLE